MRLRYLSYRRPAKAQANLRICAVSPQPPLFAHMKYGRRRRIWLQIRHLSSLDGSPCAFEEWVYGGRKSTIISWDGSNYLEIPTLGQKNIYICVFQVSALKKIGMVGRHNILFCQNILYRNCTFNTFSSIFQQIWQHFAHNKMFRVGAKT